MNPEDFGKWYVRNNQGEMISLASLVSGEWGYGSPKLERFNGLPSVEILGEPAPGFSSGQAMDRVLQIASQLPAGVNVAWTGVSYEELSSGSQAPLLYGLSLLVIFLALAALYESWAIPFAVMLAVPLGVLGVFLAVWLRGMSNDIYLQIALLITVGLTAKNAILIVEFARNLHEKEGRSLVEAALEAARLRLRPIIMTSLAFVLGVVPLAIATGAGAGSQRDIGTGVVGGMITATFLVIFWIPLFYVLVSRSIDKHKAKHPHAEGEGT